MAAPDDPDGFSPPSTGPPSRGPTPRLASTHRSTSDDGSLRFQSFFRRESWAMPSTDFTERSGLTEGHPSTFRDVLKQERKYIENKQRAATLDGTKPGAPFSVAFSGGGIRAAAFQSGVLRRLAEEGLLKNVEYLAAVSGGGYIASSFCSHALAEPKEWGEKLDDWYRRVVAKCICRMQRNAGGFVRDFQGEAFSSPTDLPARVAKSNPAEPATSNIARVDAGVLVQACSSLARRPLPSRHGCSFECPRCIQTNKPTHRICWFLRYPVSRFLGLIKTWISRGRGVVASPTRTARACCRGRSTCRSSSSASWSPSCRTPYRASWCSWCQSRRLCSCSSARRCAASSAPPTTSASGTSS